MQPGQILVNANGEERKILFASEDLIIPSKIGNFDMASGNFTKKELREFGWFLLEEPWVPKDSDRVFIVNALGGIPVAFTWEEYSEEAQNFLLKTGNYGRTYQAAELYKQKLIERMGRKEN